jgi:hypothetical protein
MPVKPFNRLILIIFLPLLTNGDSYSLTTAHSKSLHFYISILRTIFIPKHLLSFAHRIFKKKLQKKSFFKNFLEIESPLNTAEPSGFLDGTKYIKNSREFLFFLFTQKFEYTKLSICENCFLKTRSKRGRPPKKQNSGYTTNRNLQRILTIRKLGVSICNVLCVNKAC